MSDIVVGDLVKSSLFPSYGVGIVLKKNTLIKSSTQKALSRRSKTYYSILFKNSVFNLSRHSLKKINLKKD